MFVALKPAISAQKICATTQSFETKNIGHRNPSRTSSYASCHSHSKFQKRNNLMKKKDKKKKRFFSVHNSRNSEVVFFRFKSIFDG